MERQTTFMDWETQCHVCVCGKMLVSSLNGIMKSQIAETLGKKDMWKGLLSTPARLTINYRN